MSNYRCIHTAVTALVLLAGITAPAWADRDDRDKKQTDKEYRTPERGNQRQTRTPETRRDHRDSDQRRTRTPETRRDDRDRDRSQRRTPPPVRTPAQRDYVLDRRYDHNRYYPPTGHRTRRLPSGHRVHRHHNRRYYYHSGTWYLYSGAYFVVTLPPVGITLSVLPPYYTTIWIGGVPYYYANGVYYVWHPVQRVYVVTEPPPASAVSEQPTEPEKLFIYPKQGQSAEQQASDRYQCHAWATDQTGFDPTRAGGNVSVEQYVTKRSDYHRAMKACLEARGYSVK